MSQIKPRFKILALPVDGRPVTREQVQFVAGIADCELLCPSVEALGHFREEADRDRLAEWVSGNAADVDGFLFSLDMLVYGGLVPSRFIDDSTESLRARLDLLKELKQRYPDKPLYAFCATMRMSNNNENEEEKLYWAEHGTDIWNWSFYSDRFACTGNEQDRERAEWAKNRIPGHIQRDYLETRARNFSITKDILALVEEGIVDRLVLPQDDTAEYGFNIAERRQLQQLVDDRKLDKAVLVYPGADEVIYTLLVHQLQLLDQQHSDEVTPLRIALRPHHTGALAKMVARYEDRPVMESIRCQIDAAGAQLVDRESEADVVIAIHCRGVIQGDWAMQYPLEEDLGLDHDWVVQLVTDLKERQKPLALLDLAYANGGDPELMAVLEQQAGAGISALRAYAGWNTASNSIGSLVAQLCASLRTPASDEGKAHNQHLLVTRLLDDYLYQSRLRQSLRATQKARDLPDGDVTALNEVYFTSATEWLERQGFDAVQLHSVYFPWQRSFEIGLRTTVDLPSLSEPQERFA
ncbi:DUF4127 family protein [Microbulbifer elongatus]|uniref:DUF4127 family protein n=1 Tax=Microbulbifer elongatus TaxID=86173 RepID=UPI001CFE27B1|nr:DUF4127 family protein [Microbulbifer elongatus]